MSADDVRTMVADARVFRIDSSWPDPQPLPAGLPAVPALDLQLLPTALMPWVVDVSERMQCPPDYAAVAPIVAVGALIGRQLAVRPKRQDDWTVIPNLWGAIIGRPGLLKTPALDEALRPLRAMEAAAAAAHVAGLENHEAAQVIAAEARKVSAGRIRKAIKEGDKEAAEAAAREQLAAAECPVRRRYIVNDTTVEKLGELLRDNPRGVLLFRDELIGFLRSLDRDGREGDRAFYLEAWNGTGRFTYDRIGRGTLDIEACCVSILGGVQPGPLADYLRAAVHGGAGDDGLIQRFQLLVWPDPPGEWHNVDRFPNRDAKMTVAEIFRRLDHIDPGAIGAEQDGDSLPSLRFDADAQDAFDEWREALEHRLRKGGEHPAFEAHIAKYRSLVPSLALVFHLIDGGTGAIGQAAMIRAAAWAEYLEAHARRVYSSVTNSAADGARRLASRIMREDLPDAFGSRDVWRPGWTGLADRETAQAAIDTLCDLDWLVPERIETAGRPKTVYRVNPKVRGMVDDLA